MTKKEFIQEVKEIATIAINRSNEFLGSLDLSLSIDWDYDGWDNNLQTAIGVYEGGSVFSGEIIIGFNINNLYKYCSESIKRHPWSNPSTITEEAIYTNVYHEMGHGVVELLNDYLQQTDELDALYDANKELFDWVLDNEEDAVEEFAWKFYDNELENSKLYQLIQLYLGLYNQNENREIIRIMESDLKDIVKDVVKKILSESSDFVCDIDIKSIPREELEAIYIDYRLLPTITCHDHKLYNPTYIREAVGDIMEIDEVVKEIAKKYHLPPHTIGKKEGFNKVYVYVITALIGDNDKLIEEDMRRLGYFLGVRGNITVVDGKQFRVLQFEPMSQLQSDITDELKTKYKILYHWTPMYNIKSIKENGLIPRNDNSKYLYPPRTYLIKSDCNLEYLKYMGEELSLTNNNPLNDGHYTLLIISISDLDESIRFFYDPNSQFGIYTEQPIPKEYIKIASTKKFLNDLRG